MGLTRRLAILESGDPAFHGLDSASNSFLHEVSVHVACLVTESVVEGVFGFLF